jgi:PAS domain S-box-containing protein
VPSIYEIELVRKDGSVVPVEARSRFIRDREGKPISILATHRDITVRKRTEEALRESEERFRLLVENVQDYAIFLLDAAGRIITWNRGAERIKGYRAAEILGQHFSRFYPREAQAQGKPAWQLQVAAAEGRLEDEGWRVRKNGEQFWANVVITALYDERGTVRGLVKVTRDMTERKRAEEEKQKLQEQLFQARKLEALGTLAGGVAHDFNNILSAIMGFTELATDEVPEGTPVRRNLEEVLKASRRAKTLVQQILTFSRPSQQNHEPIEPSPTIEEVLTFLRASLPPTIEIRYAVDKTAGPIALSPSQL